MNPHRPYTFPITPISETKLNYITWTGHCGNCLSSLSIATYDPASDEPIERNMPGRFNCGRCGSQVMLYVNTFSTHTARELGVTDRPAKTLNNPMGRYEAT